ncbi:proton pump-interactor BIP103 isoform X3 [Cajanus cajan]|uniref:proton pump-interactor BIP103 isoform X3 n=1 Tax=Cajanus cajan TaxID=3821 RepID=UPI00098DCE54|nr:proton pump-interactor BIP103 isoform X3 [Cajanus cajan]
MHCTGNVNSVTKMPGKPDTDDWHVERGVSFREDDGDIRRQPLELIGGDLDGVKKERQALRSKIKQIDDVLKTIDKDIQTLQDELAVVSQKRDKSFESMQQLRK